MHAKDQNFVRF